LKRGVHGACTGASRHDLAAPGMDDADGWKRGWFVMFILG
jgi:hypothetical protein